MEVKINKKWTNDAYWPDKTLQLLNFTKYDILISATVIEKN
jgi:hypothetical protein